MTHVISNADDVIDSRDVISRIEELAGEHESLTGDIEDMKEALQGATNKKEKPETLMGLEFLVNEAEQALDEWQDENDKELSILRALNDEGETNSSDWLDGETMIH